MSSLRPSTLSWLIPILGMGAVVVSAAILRTTPLWLGVVVLAVVLAAVILWVTASILWPAKADRRCPVCGEEGLVRMDPEGVRGLRCELCGHSDPDASAWYLAEEEGPLEEIVLGRRGGSAR